MIPETTLARLVDRFAALEAELASGTSGSAYVKLSREHAELAPVVEAVAAYRGTAQALNDADALANDSASDPEMRALAEEERAELKERFATLERDLQLKLLPKDAADSSSAIVEVRAGTGGDEAALFAADLLGMYQRYAQLQGWRTEILSLAESDLGGFREAVMEVAGQGAYAKLKFESGVHRVQRVPVTEAGGRIHTSAATVAVLPEPEDVDIHIEDKDLRIDVFRASGAGGQHVNKTSSAVRLTHIPTGVVVTCQNERSQQQNRDVAWRVLRSRLLTLQQAAHAEHLAELKGESLPAEWGSQIRSYVLHPYTMVKDHRTGFEVGDVSRVLDGDLDGFVRAYLLHAARGAS
ncbi:MAG TPA: peptide chain release factor 1, partial [Rhizomicrobium sp.]